MKPKILALLAQQISDEMQLLRAQQEEAARAATHEESRPENEHDTRAVEASYLAAGQAQRYEELRRGLALLKQFPIRDFGAEEPVGIGALVELLLGSERLTYLMCPAAGGYKINCEGKTVQIVTAESLLGQELLDKHVGDEVELNARGTRIYEILSIS